MPQTLQLKVSIKGTEPVIWRRIRVRDNTDFFELHYMIATTFFWPETENYHFIIDGRKIAPTGVESISVRDDGKLDVVAFLKPGTVHSYFYNEVASWELDIHVEQVVEGELNAIARCDGGAFAAPPNQCGNVQTFQSMLNTGQLHRENEQGVLSSHILEKINANILVAEKHFQLMRQELYDRLNDILAEQGVDFRILAIKSNCVQEFLENKVAKEFLLENLYEKWQQENCPEQETVNRLVSEGIALEKAREMVLHAWALEWYSDLKYGSCDFLDRYAENLEKLPAQPQHAHSVEQATALLENVTMGVPFELIEYLHNQPTIAVIDELVDALENACNEDRFLNEEIFSFSDAPLFYAIVAEAHIHEKLIEPIINVFTQPEDALYALGDFFSDQCGVVLCKLAESFPHQVIPRVYEVAKSFSGSTEHNRIGHYYDVWEIDNPESTKYNHLLLDLFEDTESPAHDLIAGTASILQLKDAIPTLKALVEKRSAERDKAGKNAHPIGFSDLIEYETALNELENGLTDDSVPEPYFKFRGDWKSHYSKYEHCFYEDIAEDDDFELFQDFINEDVDTPLPPSEPKKAKPGRNDPCYCGSGKKYKKCCLKQDRELEQLLSK